MIDPQRTLDESLDWGIVSNVKCQDELVMICERGRGKKSEYLRDRLQYHIRVQKTALQG